MRVTKHADTRIRLGDKKGLRTVLSVAEVLERINSSAVVKSGSESYFWSEVDDCCLLAIIKGQGKVLVTVHEASRDLSPWMGMLAKSRLLGIPVFKDSQVKTYDPYFAVGIGMVEYDHKRGIDALESAKDLHCAWFDFKKCDSDAFWTKDFHEMLADFVSQHIQLNEVSKNKLKKLRIEIHGNGWACLCPLFVPFELLQIPSPFD